MGFDLVLFGGTGDLAWRKLLPALFQAHRHGMLPDGGRILAIGRTAYTDDAYREWLRERFADVEDAKRPADGEFARFAALVHYLRADLAQPADYARLRAWVRADADAVVFYLATSPHLFPVVAEQLGRAGLNGPSVRLVLEKPLGHDLESAQAINRVVRASFAEGQALRIDHYLGKPAVQNLMALRFGNVLFEPLWRRESIASIHVRLDESIGVGTRGDFYDQTGALRDMIQNHALQLLTMIAMEPPARLTPDDIHAEKLKVLHALKPFDEGAVSRDVVRAQYAGYRDEAKVARDSRTETFVSLRAEVQNWRWAGVPFFLTTGKRLAEKSAEIVVQFHPTPHSIFPGATRPNKLVIKLQPEDGLELHLLAAKGASYGEALSPVFLDLDFEKAFAQDRVGAYERLLLDAIAGRLNLFVRGDEQEAAWRWVEPVLRAWRREDADGVGLLGYEPGSSGPRAF